MANKETVKQITYDGELQDLMLWFDNNIPKDGTWRYSGNITDDNTFENMRIYQVPTRKTQEQDLSHIPGDLLSDGLIDLSDNRIYAKIYSREIPEFSKKTYLGYWYLVCCHLSRDTNIVYNLKPRKHYIGSKGEFQEVCDCSPNIAYKFIKECEEKGYIAKFELKANEYFVANPTYTLNGNKIPILLANLFGITGKIISSGEEE